ncbi:hypothetical protein GCM10025751_51990 [Haladaptatus pallidirubidus]|uniref:Uncharacterized protein n=1 Tax=Haladaptatus pallidirubidus TaxID=1008152 RepID=A0AAV3UQD5_9EURY
MVEEDCSFMNNSVLYNLAKDNTRKLLFLLQYKITLSWLDQLAKFRAEQASPKQDRRRGCANAFLSLFAAYIVDCLRIGTNLFDEEALLARLPDISTFRSIQ